MWHFPHTHVATEKTNQFARNLSHRLRGYICTAMYVLFDIGTYQDTQAFSLFHINVLIMPPKSTNWKAAFELNNTYHTAVHRCHRLFALEKIY